MVKNYQKTLIACYLGFITQAIAANFAPLLFLTFHRVYGIPLGKIAVISTTFFFTQLLIDVICAKFVDKIGYRVSAVASELFSALGLIGLAFLPEVCQNPFVGILCCVILYAIGSGLIEVIGSPIVEACPFENKASVMSLLHSFYCWGSVGVILFSTIFFSLFGIDHWRILACVLAIVPIVNAYNFGRCPIERLTEEGEGYGIKKLMSIPLFLVAMLLMVCAGASELSMAQWASAYVESALGISKKWCDIAGPCFFAVMMGISRLFYGKYGEKVDLHRFMIGSGMLCLFCYFLASFGRMPILGLMGCVVCGFSVGIMWPGTISITSSKIPLGGTAMFALLAMAGDFGGAIGPFIIGVVTQKVNNDLQAGMLAGSVFPLILIIATCLIRKMKVMK